MSALSETFLWLEGLVEIHILCFCLWLCLFLVFMCDPCTIKPMLWIKYNEYSMVLSTETESWVWNVCALSEYLIGSLICGPGLCCNRLLLFLFQIMRYSWKHFSHWCDHPSPSLVWRSWCSLRLRSIQRSKPNVLNLSSYVIFLLVSKLYDVIIRILRKPGQQNDQHVASWSCLNRPKESWAQKILKSWRQTTSKSRKMLKSFQLQWSN